MKIVTGLLVILVVLTFGYFVTIWQQLPTVGPNVAAMVPQPESVRMGLSSAEQPPALPPPPAPAGEPNRAPAPVPPR